MKARVLLVIIFAALLVVCAKAQQPAPPAAGNTKTSEIAEPKEITLTVQQQRPIVLLLRERELINARIEGAVKALMGFLGLSPSEWDVVSNGEGITVVRRKSPSPPQEEKK